MAANRWAVLAWSFLAWTAEGFASGGVAAGAQETPRAGLDLPGSVQDEQLTPVPDAQEKPQEKPPEKPAPEKPVQEKPVEKPVPPEEKPGPKLDDILSSIIQLTPPTPDKLFRLESEQQFQDRLRKEDKIPKRKMEFPEPIKPMPVNPLPRRTWASTMEYAEPCYVCYGRLWFEQPNFERYGWDLGVMAPGVSATLFLTDFAAWPLHWLRDPFRCFECSAGQCLPGDDRPLLWTPLRNK